MKETLAIAALAATLTTPTFAEVYIPPQVGSGMTWDDVVESVQQTGISRSHTFRNQAGNTWNVWIASTGYTLLFPNLVGYRGDHKGFTCKASPVANYWSKCTRFDLDTGQRETEWWVVSVRVSPNGIVEDNTRGD